MIAYEAVLESKLQFAPRCIVEKYMKTENDNYSHEETFETHDIRYMPRNANLISSHALY